MIAEIATRYGSFVVMENDRIISTSLRIYGEWAQAEIDKIALFILPGQRVYDVGAFIGTHARAFSTFVGMDGQVVSFEPRTDTRLILEKNAALSDCKNIVVEGFALGRTNEVRSIPSVNAAASNNFGGFSIQETSASEANEDAMCEKITIRTIDSFDFGKVDFIKIDVEGMEIDVLVGAQRVIQQYQPCILAECNTMQSGVDVLRFCEEQKYRVYGLSSAAFNKHNFNQVTENFLSNATEIGLLLIAETRVATFERQLTELALPELTSADDLVLLILHKPQYPYEVLEPQSQRLGLDLQYPSARSDACTFALDLERKSTERLATELGALKLERQRDLEKFSLLSDASTAKIEAEKQAVLRLTDQLEKAVLVSNALAAKIEAERLMLLRVPGQLEEVKAARNRVQAELIEATNRCSKVELELSETIRTCQDAEARLNASREDLVRIFASRSWLVTKPLRWSSRLIRGEFVQAAAPLKRIFMNRPRRALGEDAPPRPHAGVVSQPERRSRSISVVLPIYRDVEMTKRCIDHALPAILEMPGANLFAINDCSPDAEMQAMINRFAERYPGVVIVDRNPINLGFVKTVNKGLARFADNDIVLLNSDVIVPKSWLSRLAREAYSSKRISTVTPFSNNATVCSFPVVNFENPQPFGLEVDEIDSVFCNNELPCIASPTGIGFCMYIRRDCLQEIGFLDTERFGRGYGEENDLCQRAEKAGWTNLLSPNLYAYHEGGVSFAADKIVLIERAMKVLDQLHPTYHADVHSFIAHDRLKSARVARYIQLLSKVRLPKVVHIAHGRGGGVIQHIEELAEFYGDKIACMVINPVPGNGVKLHLSTHPAADTMLFQLPNDFESLQQLLLAAGVDTIHFHHSIELNRCIFDLPRLIGAKIVVTVHDFYWINGNPTLTNRDGLFEVDGFDKTVNPLYQLPEAFTPQSWRDSFQDFLTNADMVIFPSSSTRELFARYFVLNNSIVAPHIEVGRNIKTVPAPLRDANPVTIGVLGAIGKEKGADLLEALALIAQRNNAPFKFKLIGYAYRSLKAVQTTGIFENKQLPDLIKENGIDLIFFPARWPETYSYTLSYALDTPLPIFAPRVGAFIERIDARANSRLFNYQDSPEEIYAALADFITAVRAGAGTISDAYVGDKGDLDFYKNRYLNLVCSKTVRPAISSAFDLTSTVGSLVLRRAPIREKMLLALCRVNARRKLSWLRNTIPISVRRKIRRVVAGPSHK